MYCPNGFTALFTSINYSLYQFSLLHLFCRQMTILYSCSSRCLYSNCEILVTVHKCLFSAGDVCGARLNGSLLSLQRSPFSSFVSRDNLWMSTSSHIPLLIPARLLEFNLVVCPRTLHCLFCLVSNAPPSPLHRPSSPITYCHRQQFFVSTFFSLQFLSSVPFIVYSILILRHKLKRKGETVTASRLTLSLPRGKARTKKDPSCHTMTTTTTPAPTILRAI